MRDVWNRSREAPLGPLTSTYGDRVADPEAGRRFGRLLREARERRDWQQQDVVDKSGVSLSTYGRWERGKVENPKPTEVQAVCRVLGIRTIEAALALGYVAQEDTEPLPPIEQRDPALQELIDMFEDPNIPEATKTAALDYLRYLRNKPQPPETGESRAAS